MDFKQKAKKIATEFQFEAREAFFKLDLDATVEDYNYMIGALVNELSELFTDKDLSPNSPTSLELHNHEKHMDVLKTKLLKSIENSVETANGIKAKYIVPEWGNDHEKT